MMIETKKNRKRERERGDRGKGVKDWKEEMERDKKKDRQTDRQTDRQGKVQARDKGRMTNEMKKSFIEAQNFNAPLLSFDNLLATSLVRYSYSLPSAPLDT